MKYILCVLCILLAFMSLSGCINGWPQKNEPKPSYKLMCPRHTKTALINVRIIEIGRMEVVLGDCPRGGQTYMMTLPITTLEKIKPEDIQTLKGAN